MYIQKNQHQASLARLYHQVDAVMTRLSYSSSAGPSGGELSRRLNELAPSDPGGEESAAPEDEYYYYTRNTGASVIVSSSIHRSAKRSIDHTESRIHSLLPTNAAKRRRHEELGDLTVEDEGRFDSPMTLDEEDEQKDAMQIDTDIDGPPALFAKRAMKVRRWPPPLPSMSGITETLAIDGGPGGHDGTITFLVLHPSTDPIAPLQISYQATHQHSSQDSSSFDIVTLASFSNHNHSATSLSNQGGYVQVIDQGRAPNNIPISSTLYAALRLLRKPHTPRTLWIDDSHLDEVWLPAKEGPPNPLHQLTQVQRLGPNSLIIFLDEEATVGSMSPYAAGPLQESDNPAQTTLALSLLCNLANGSKVKHRHGPATYHINESDPNSGLIRFSHQNLDNSSDTSAGASRHADPMQVLQPLPLYGSALDFLAFATEPPPLPLQPNMFHYPQQEFQSHSLPNMQFLPKPPPPQPPPIMAHLTDNLPFLLDFSENVPPASYTALWNALAALFNKPWFRRMRSLAVMANAHCFRVTAATSSNPRDGLQDNLHYGGASPSSSKMKLAASPPPPTNTTTTTVEITRPIEVWTGGHNQCRSGRVDWWVLSLAARRLRAELPHIVEQYNMAAGVDAVILLDVLMRDKQAWYRSQQQEDDQQGGSRSSGSGNNGTSGRSSSSCSLQRWSLGELLAMTARFDAASCAERLYALLECSSSTEE